MDPFASTLPQVDRVHAFMLSGSLIISNVMCRRIFCTVKWNCAVLHVRPEHLHGGARLQLVPKLRAGIVRGHWRVGVRPLSCGNLPAGRRSCMRAVRGRLVLAGGRVCLLGLSVGANFIRGNVVMSLFPFVSISNRYALSEHRSKREPYFSTDRC